MIRPKKNKVLPRRPWGWYSIMKVMGYAQHRNLTQNAT